MRSQGDELALQLVGVLERHARLALLCEETGAIERETGEGAERLQELPLLVAEVRREGARVHEQPPERERPRRQLVAASRSTVPCVPIRRPYGVLQRDAAGADDERHRLEDAGRDVLLARRRHQLADRLLHPRLLRAAPHDPEHRRRGEAEDERNSAERRDQRDDERAGRVFLADRDGEQQRRRDRRRGEREHPHPPPRDGRLGPAGQPEPDRDERQQHRPVDEERDRVEREPPGPRLALGRQVRQGERRDHEQRAQHVHEARQRALAGVEGRREAVEQIRKEQEDREVDPLDDLADGASPGRSGRRRPATITHASVTNASAAQRPVLRPGSRRHWRTATTAIAANNTRLTISTSSIACRTHASWAG